MKQKKDIQIKLILISICVVAIVVIFLSKTLISDHKKDMSDYVTQTELSKMLSFTMYSEEEWKDILGRQSGFYVTYGQVLNVLDTLGIYELFQEDISRGNRSVKINKADWIAIYDQILELFDTDHRIAKKELLILGTNKSIGELKDGEVYTDSGVFLFKDISLEDNKNQILYVITKDNEIISIINQVNKEAVLENIWITKTTETGFQIFSGGYYLDFVEDNLNEEYSNVLADVIIKSGNVTMVRVKGEKISGKILAIHADGIEIEGYGLVPMSDNFKVYKVYGELAQLAVTDLVVGYEITEFVTGEGKICAGLVNRSLTMENIRVLIKDTKESDIYHNELLITGTTDFTIYYGEYTEHHPAGEDVTINPERGYFIENRMKIIPDTLSGEIIIKSIERQQGNPSYRGSMEIVKDTNGLVLINDVLIEEYLYSVLPSEMPENYGLEALKAQAVCARSYAYNQLISNGYPEYGAHVDDSVQFQVYNNQDENQTSIQAVKDTYGQVANYQDKVIEAYYFSTSYGHTSTSQVWNSEAVEAMGYLSGVTVGADASNIADLTTEEDFKNFILNPNESLYESKESWFRWNTLISLKDIGNTINRKLATRYEANPSNILVKNSKGNYESKPINTIGTVKAITVAKRLSGGVVHEIIIEGSKATIKVITEYNIRCLLAPENSDIIRQNDTTVKGSAMLPSGYFFLDNTKMEDGSEGIKVIGGGYGHGVGLSQNGAKIMAASGMSYEDILKFYYSGVEIVNIYE